MQIYGVSFDMVGKQPIVLLKTVDGNRFLPIWIGHPEAAAILMKLQGASTPRPMTHELFAQVLGLVHADVIAVRLIGREQGNYLAELDLMAPRGRERIACRPSDALVLALRMPVPAPILVDERLLETLEDVVPQEG